MVLCNGSSSNQLEIGGSNAYTKYETRLLLLLPNQSQACLQYFFVELGFTLTSDREGVTVINVSGVEA